MKLQVTHDSRRLRCCLVTLMLAQFLLVTIYLIQSIRNMPHKKAFEDKSVNSIALLTNASTRKFVLPPKDIYILKVRDFKTLVGKRLPSLPVAYWQKNKNYWKKSNETCPPFPSIDDIIFDNTYWQTLRTSKGTFYLYGAYMDKRKTLNQDPTVRILAVHDRIKPRLVTHCQLWFQNRKEATIVRAYKYQYIWLKYWGSYKNYRLQPYLIDCILPKKLHHLVPVSVSFVEKSCDRATNNLRVHYSSSKMKNFAVCVKELDFLEDISERLVEWIEFVRLMGADKIFFYELQVHPNISKILEYYSAIGVVIVTPYTLPGSQLLNPQGLPHMYLKRPIFNKRQMDLITYNDCLYRNIHEHRWVVLLDIDEIIVPVKDNNWNEMMQRVLPLSKMELTRNPRASYVAYHTYFLDFLTHDWQKDIPPYMHMLQHIYRTHNYTHRGYYVKAFHETDRVLTLHNHFPFSCLGGTCSLYWMETDEARLHHYRKSCLPYINTTCYLLCKNVDRDALVWQWREPLITRVDAVLRSLGFSSPQQD